MYVYVGHEVILTSIRIPSTDILCLTSHLTMSLILTISG